MKKEKARLPERRPAPASPGSANDDESKWAWMMRWCKKNGLAPATASVWELAEKRWIEANLPNAGDERPTDQTTEDRSSLHALVGDGGLCAICGAHVGTPPPFEEAGKVFCCSVCFIRNMRDEWDDELPSPTDKAEAQRRERAATGA